MNYRLNRLIGKQLKDFSNMHLLFTNNTLQGLAGSELYVYEMALEMQRRGHRVSCFTLAPGLISAKLREKGVTVATTLAELEALPPVDLIHAHHRLEARLAAALFPLTPLVYASLGPFHPLEQAGPDRGIFTRYIAISRDVKDKMTWAQQIPAAKISVVPNFVDLSRFTARRPLAEKPRRVLLLTNYFKTEGLLEEACRLAGDLELKAIGAQAESVWNVEDYIDWADVVVTSARGALQALAMGRAVVVYRPTGSDGLLTPANFETSLNHNFSGRAFGKLFEAPTMAEQLTAYDPGEVRQLQERVRAEFSLTRVAGSLLQVYQQTITEYRQRWPASSEGERYRLVLAGLADFLAGFKERDNLKAHFSFVLGDKAKAINELLPAQHEILQFLQDVHAEAKVRAEHQHNLEVYNNQLHQRFEQTSVRLGESEAQARLARQELEQAALRVNELEKQNQARFDELENQNKARFDELEKQNRALLLERDWLKQGLAHTQAELLALKKTGSVRLASKVGNLLKKIKPGN